jgi:hypothetical protein
MNTLGFLFVLIFLGLIVLFTFLSHKDPVFPARELQAFTILRRSIGRAVEAGTRLHISLGQEPLTGPHGAVALAGLEALDRVTQSTGIGDQPPLATAGEGSLAILAQDELHNAARDQEVEYDPTAGRVTGLTPFSYAAGVLPVIEDEKLEANLLIGSFGSEIALITAAGDRAGIPTIAGTDDLPGLAALYVSVDEPLIGEEAFSSGAYLNGGPAYMGSLRAQDVLRWVIIILILLGALLKLGGLL